jgi:hypothetical protein
VLLQRASFDTPLCEQLAREIAEQELRELQRAHGHIESRVRFKPQSSHPLLENRRVNRLYIDECGTSHPQSTAKQPVFALAAVAMDVESVQAYRQAADEIKKEFFGTTAVAFHEPEMRQRKGRYYFAGDTEQTQAFEAAIAGLLVETSFTVFGVAVRKAAFEHDFLASGIDPYLPTDVYSLAILMLLERYVDFLASQPERQMGRVTFESLGPREDAVHQLEYARVLVDGSQWVPESAFRNWLEAGIRFRPKQGSDPLELADMFGRELYEWAVAGCTGSPKHWELFGGRIHLRGDGQMGKFGVKVFPDSDIRDRIEAHRAQIAVLQRSQEN